MDGWMALGLGSCNGRKVLGYKSSCLGMGWLLVSWSVSDLCVCVYVYDR